MAIDPCIQESPRWMSGELPPFQAAVQALIPDTTPAGLLKTLYWMAAVGMLTPVSPISFPPFGSPGEPTFASAKAIESDVPSIASRIALTCWWANSPVYRTLDQFVPLSP